jgi:hypothetical protein
VSARAPALFAALGLALGLAATALLAPAERAECQGLCPEIECWSSDQCGSPGRCVCVGEPGGGAGHCAEVKPQP